MESKGKRVPTGDSLPFPESDMQQNYTIPKCTVEENTIIYIALKMPKTRARVRMTRNKHHCVGRRDVISNLLVLDSTLTGPAGQIIGKSWNHHMNCQNYIKQVSHK
uniref:Putative ovule protein n=1 Tax=Solanum chacoense TaxID=4108 RepID=A0A0V0GV90_SOLCH